MLSYNLNKPMSWDDFKRLPTNVQAEYITNLQNKYGATAVDIAAMFDVQPLTVRRHIETNGVNVTFPRGHSMSAARRQDWEAFLCSTLEMAAPVVEEPVQVCEDKVEVAENPDKDNRSMTMQKFCLSFRGNIDVNMIANSLRLILGNQSNGEVEIICNLA